MHVVAGLGVAEHALRDLCRVIQGMFVSGSFTYVFVASFFCYTVLSWQGTEDLPYSGRFEPIPGGLILLAVLSENAGAEKSLSSDLAQADGIHRRLP